MADLKLERIERWAPHPSAAPLTEQKVDSIREQRQDQIVVVHAVASQTGHHKAGLVFRRGLQIRFRVGLEKAELSLVIGPNVEAHQCLKPELAVHLGCQFLEPGQNRGVGFRIERPNAVDRDRAYIHRREDLLVRVQDPLDGTEHEGSAVALQLPLPGDDRPADSDAELPA